MNASPAPDIISYVCGLVFARGFEGPRMLMIRKQRPDWQEGRLNGLGGRVKAGESPRDAMVRKALDEAGLESEAGWAKLAVVSGKGFCVHFFSTWLDVETFDTLSAKTDEPLVRLHVGNLRRYRLVDRIGLLVSLALDDTIAKPVMMTGLELTKCQVAERG